MLKYPCLVLDHDDTVVQTERTIGYPYFRDYIERIRPGRTLSFAEYVQDCNNMVFADMCREKWKFTEAELQEEYLGWKAYSRLHVPEACPGIHRIVKRQKELGGMVCVVSHSSAETISRDYRTHFNLLPDDIYGWDLPEEQRKPNPYPLEQIMKKYGFTPEQILVVDDMKPAREMARKVGAAIAFAQWGKADSPEICAEMQTICDYAFPAPQDLEEFLFRV